MKLFLPKLATSEETVELAFIIDERLPPQAGGPCQLNCKLNVTGDKHDFFLMNLNISGRLAINCVRCTNSFDWVLDEVFTIAVSDTEQKVEALMSDYESMISHNYHIDLIDVVTDSLNLVAPETHPDIALCDLSDVEAYLSE